MATILDNLPRLKTIEHSVEPTWGPDSGRNTNSGKFTGTFVGWFDILQLEFGKTTQTEMTAIKNSIEKPIIEDVSFVDSKNGHDKIEGFYGTAIKAKRKSKNGMYEPFSINLKAIERRRDM